MSFTKSKNSLEYLVFCQFYDPSEIDYPKLSIETGFSVSKLSGMVSRVRSHSNIFVDLVFNHGIDPKTLPAWFKRPPKGLKLLKVRKVREPDPIPPMPHGGGVQAGAYQANANIQYQQQQSRVTHEPFVETPIQDDDEVPWCVPSRISRFAEELYIKMNRPSSPEEIKQIMDDAVFECLLWEDNLAWEAEARARSEVFEPDPVLVLVGA